MGWDSGLLAGITAAAAGEASSAGGRKGRAIGARASLLCTIY